MAEHGVLEVGALALDDVQHPMGETLPARQVNREGRAAHSGRARGAAQHLLLRRREVLADADLADNPGADFRIVLGHAAVCRNRLGDQLNGHVPDIARMRGLEIKARAHDDVQSGAPADALQRRRVAADPDICRVDDGSTSVFDEMRELFDRDLDVEESAIVAIEKRVHAEVADHRNIERPFGEADVRGAARTLPPARRVEHDMLVHEGHAHRLDGNRAEHRAHHSGVNASLRFGHGSRPPTLSSSAVPSETSENSARSQPG